MSRFTVEGSDGRWRITARRSLAAAGVLLLYVVLSALMTWPLVRHLDIAVSDPGDPLLNAWILDWVQHSLAERPRYLFHPTIFHPAAYALAFSEHLLGIALVCLPFSYIAQTPIELYNYAMLLSFVLAGVGGFALAHVATGRTSVALPAGVMFAFLPYRFDHLAHLQILWTLWLPLMLAAIIIYYRSPSWLSAALVGVTTFFNAISNIHWMVFGGLTIVLTVMVLGSIGRWHWRTYGRLAACLTLAGMAVLPTIYPYFVAKDLYEMRRYRKETKQGSGELSDWLAVAPRNKFYEGVLPSGTHERRFFPGIGILVFAFWGASTLRHGGRGTPKGPLLTRLVVKRLLDFLGILAAIATLLPMVPEQWRPEVPVWPTGSSISLAILLTVVAFRLWFFTATREGYSLRDWLQADSRRVIGAVAAVWVIVGFLGSLGLNAFFYETLFRFEVFRSIRTPARFVMVSYVGLLLFASLGLASIFPRNGAKRLVATMLITIALLAELRASPISWYLIPRETPSVYHWLKLEAPPGAVIELPITVNAASEFFYLLGHTLHRRPLVNGTSGFQPPIHHEAVRLWEADDHPGFVDLLRSVGVRIIILHADEVIDDSDRYRSFVSEGLRSGTFSYLGRFENGIEGDYAYLLLEPGEEPLPTPRPIGDVGTSTHFSGLP
jgi:hypothetical protein